MLLKLCHIKGNLLLTCINREKDHGLLTHFYIYDDSKHHLLRSLHLNPPLHPYLYMVFYLFYKDLHQANLILHLYTRESHVNHSHQTIEQIFQEFF